jgi:phosphopantothenoylcysteine decarboxylase/phosphopantothenate--cysteine ligase
VQSAGEMYEACIKIFPAVQIAVMSAAVADYTPVSFSSEKIKKNSETFTLELSRTKDILHALGEIKKTGQILVGFALENTDEASYARKKLKSKNADMIVLNSLNDAGAGFGFDTNQVTIFERGGEEISYGQKPKQLVAADIVDRIIKFF